MSQTVETQIPAFIAHQSSVGGCGSGVQPRWALELDRLHMQVKGEVNHRPPPRGADPSPRLSDTKPAFGPEQASAYVLCRKQIPQRGRGYAIWSLQLLQT